MCADVASKFNHFRERFGEIFLLKSNIRAWDCAFFDMHERSKPTPKFNAGLPKLFERPLFFHANKTRALSSSCKQYSRPP